jgi:hypothetical protein
MEREMRTLLARARTTWLVGLLAALLLVGAVPATVSAAGAISISGDIGGTSLRITAPTDTPLTLTWKSAGGAVKETASFTSSDWGVTYYESVNETMLAVGDRIKVSDGTNVHVLVVPQLSINVNRERDTLKGTGPAGDVVRLRCSGGPLPGFEGCVWRDRVRVDSTGHWGRHLPWDIRGGAMYHAVWLSASGDRVWTTGVAPFVHVTIGRATFSGSFRPDKTAHIVVRDGVTLDPLATGSAVGGSFDGDMSGRFRDAGNAPYRVVPGDRISSDIAADLDFVVPDIQASADAATDTVSGQCFDQQPAAVKIDLYRNGFHRGYAWDGTDETSHFATYMPHPESLFYNEAVIKVGDHVSVACMTPEGDWITRWVTAE